ncbi:zf-HC2 domain-containing protein [Gaopeijia maritima]|uniref:hypothetical protein n=1 Tax=Gaopeijia maritima TaxID=3119007 RepID=UPI0032499D28
MIHLDDGVLRAWIDRELGAEAARVTTHIESCDHCRARVHELRRAEVVVRDALALLDGPVPHELAWARVTAGARAPRSAHRPESHRRVRWFDAPLARAAGIALLCAGGVAAATVPGSPLRSLWMDSAATPTVDGAAAEIAPLAGPALEAGIRAPASASVRIELSAPSGTAVEIVAVDGRAGVFGAPSADFSAGEGWLRAAVTEGSVRIEVPRGAASDIEINGTLAAAFLDGAFRRTPSGAVGGDDGPLRFEVR